MQALTIFISNIPAVSHIPLRKEKNCLNCGAAVTGRYCAECGQENVEPKESAGHLIAHFFNDVTHFDGKFFSSMKYLLFKPGFLSEEYMKGRRISYLNPIRMYLFISAIFFLLLANFFESKTVKATDKKKLSKKTSFDDGARSLRSGIRELAVALDSVDRKKPADTERIILKNGGLVLSNDLDTSIPKTVKAYDSLQKLLPADKRDGPISRYFTRKGIAVGEVSRNNKSEFARQVMANFYHSLPYMLFLSFPILALLLKLLYVRRKQYYYVSHAIFIIHFFSLVFIALLLANIFKAIGGWGNWVAVFLYLGIIVYLYAAMLRFYKQGWFKTFVKFSLFYLIGSFVVIVLVFLVFINSALNAV